MRKGSLGPFSGSGSAGKRKSNMCSSKQQQQGRKTHGQGTAREWESGMGKLRNRSWTCPIGNRGSGDDITSVAPANHARRITWWLRPPRAVAGPRTGRHDVPATCANPVSHLSCRLFPFQHNCPIARSPHWPTAPCAAPTHCLLLLLLLLFTSFTSFTFFTCPFYPTPP